MTGLVDGLLVRPDRMRENIDRGLGLHASSRVLLALVDDGGMPREEAYAIVQRCALRAADERVGLRDLLALEPTVARLIPLSRLDACFDDTAFLRHVPTIVARLDRIEVAAAMTLAGAFVRSGKVRDLYDLDAERLCSSPRTGCRRSTSSCRRRSRTRAAS